MTTPASRRDARPRRPVRWLSLTTAVPLVAVLLVCVGVVCLALAVLRATAWSPAATTVAQVRAPAAAPVLVAPANVLGRDAATVTITATASSPSAPVFVGVARAQDAEAYLGAVTRAQLTAVTGDGAQAGVEVSARSGEASLPDPAGVDVWAAQATGSGTVDLQWPQLPGDWEVVVASDGTAAAPAMALAFANPPRSTGAAGFAAVGLALLVLGGLVLAAIVRRLRRASRAREARAAARAAHTPSAGLTRTRTPARGLTRTPVTPAPASTTPRAGDPVQPDDVQPVRPFRRTS